MKKYSPEQVQKMIDDYFDRKPVKMRDADGDLIPLTQNSLMYDMRPPTRTGLIRETLGSRNWRTYAEDPEYADILEDGLSRVEEWHEARLSQSGCQGSIFYLKNHGKGWRDDIGLDPKPVQVVAMSLDKDNEDLFKKNLEVFFGSKSE